MMGGLAFELLFASLIIGWGFWELRGLRRDRRKAEEKARAEAGEDKRA